MSICFVEDEDDVINTYTKYFSKEYVVRGFSSAKDAITAFQENYQPDLIVTDLRMPGHSGFDFINYLKGAKMNVPVVIVTAYADKKTALKALEYKVAAVCEKPISLKQLEKVVKDVLDLHKGRDLSHLIELEMRSIQKVNKQLLFSQTHHYQEMERLLVESDSEHKIGPEILGKYTDHLRKEIELSEKIEVSLSCMQNLMKKKKNISGEF